MSKLRENYRFAGPLSRIMIFGGLAWTVWLFAAYLAHHQSSNWATHSWFTNPNYHYNYLLGGILVVTVSAGIAFRSFRTPPTYRAQPFIGSQKLSDESADQLLLAIAAFIFAVAAVGVLFWDIVTWWFHFGATNWMSFNPTTHSGGPIWYVSMWQIVVIGWSLLMVGFCLSSITRIDEQKRVNSSRPYRVSIKESQKGSA